MGLCKRGFIRLLRVLAVPLAFAVEAGRVTAETNASPRLFADRVTSTDSTVAISPVNQVGFFVDDIQGQSGQDVPVLILLPPAADLAKAGAGPGSFILIRNMPEGVWFSAGMSSGRLWVLPLRNVATLKLISEGVTGDFSLEFHLVGTNNKPLAKQAVALNLHSPAIIGGRGTAAVATARPELPADKLAPNVGGAPLRESRPPPEPRLAPQRESALLSRGEDLLREGGLAGARIIFEELARKGSAKGALALARSYDPSYIRTVKTSALTPDLNKALEWYRRAEELGSAEAGERISELLPARR